MVIIRKKQRMVSNILQSDNGKLTVLASTTHDLFFGTVE